MRRFSWTTPLLATAVLAAGAIPIACGGSGATHTGSTSGAGGGGTGGHSSASGCFITCGGPDAGPSTFAVTCDASTISVVDGVSTPVTCTAATGSTAVVGAAWVVDLSGVATVSGTGVVTATGTQGGAVSVTASYEGQTASASITVNVKATINPSMVTPANQAILQGAAGADASVVWAYPYDGTVFPKGLLAPNLMWNGSAAGDTYYVSLKGKYVDLEIYTGADPPSTLALDPASWTMLTESGPGGPVAVHVARLPAGGTTASVVVDHTWTIANGSLRGTVYYWSNNLGRVLRIKPGAAAPEDFLPPAAHDACTTCHAVSANGSTLIIGGDSTVSVLDLIGNTPIISTSTVGKPVRNWAMAAVSPDGKTLIENNQQALPGPPGDAAGDAMWDTGTVTKRANTGLEGVFLGMPAFSPDGTKIAYVDTTSNGLGVYDYDAANIHAQNQVSLVGAGADPATSIIAFPSMSPDAKWIVYHRGSAAALPGSQAFCSNTMAALDTRCGSGDLYLASVQSPGTEQRLAQIDGDGYPFAAGARDQSFNYEPTFAPLEAGGFMWVVFTSRRTLGNQLTGSKDVTKQLWVAAIDKNPQPGKDPSHPAFWVPGQDATTLNMRGFWSLDPCKPSGAACGAGSECCNSNCDNGVCTDPNPSGCAGYGAACTSAASCCDPKATCVNSVCSEPPPP